MQINTTELIWAILTVLAIILILHYQKAIKTFFKQLVCKHSWYEPHLFTNSDGIFIRYCSKCDKKQISSNHKKWITIR